MLGFLTLVKVNSGIARDAFTPKVALSGRPTRSIGCTMHPMTMVTEGCGRGGPAPRLDLVCRRPFRSGMVLEPLLNAVQLATDH